MTTAHVSIEGLTEFQRSLKAIDRDLGKALRIALNDAADLIVTEARPKIPNRSGRARRSVRTASTQTKGRVKGGGKRTPYYPWLDFGGRIGADGPTRPFLKRGRYIYDAYFRNRGEYTKLLEAQLVKVAEAAGFEVS